MFLLLNYAIFAIMIMLLLGLSSSLQQITQRLTRLEALLVPQKKEDQAQDGTAHNAASPPASE